MLTLTLKKLLIGIYGALTLEDIFPHNTRRVFLKIFAVAIVAFAVWILFQGEVHNLKLRGGLFICISVYFFIFTLETYFYSVFIEASRGKWKVPFEIGRIIFYADNEDLVRGLLFSDLGDETLKRLGFTESDIKAFLSCRGEVSFGKFLASFDSHLSIELYAKTVCKEDKDFANLLFSKGLGEKEFAGALRWVIDKDFKKIENERWWSRASLGRIQGIGKNWSYGEVYVLERYGEDLTETAGAFSGSYEKISEKAVDRIESVIAREHGANAVVVSEDENSRTDVVTMLAGRINEGVAMPLLKHKRVYLLNPNLIIESSHDKISFENEFTLMLAQAARAENIIMVIPYFSSFIRSAEIIGVDVIGVLAPYMGSKAIHIIALDSVSEYHGFLATKETFVNNFEMVNIENRSDEGILHMLKSESEKIEKKYHMLMTYPALLAIADSVKQYFDLSSAGEKATDILLDSFPYCLLAGRKIIQKEDILHVVEQKTGIPTSVPVGEERETLLNLSELLHSRVVGQDEAVNVVADALKRSRAGVHNPDKPIGTFLFLGPTGVGKTETTKALADIFFGSEENMSRLDMSEFKDEYAMERLIGSFGSGKAGRLSMMIHKKPYGVLLLDEFEKTTGDIMNLFLRIFDEGVFTDAEGKKVNTKNNIIIATSNAGSELIWDIVKSGQKLEDKKEEIIDSIINQGFFKPELLNRFDAVVIFHPLQKSDLKKIADMAMTKFSERMSAKGISVDATQSAIDYLVAKGTDPKFGARPMNRAISEEIEKLVADKIIKGEIGQGSRVTFEVDDTLQLCMKIQSE